MPETRAWPDKFGESQTWQIWDCKRLLRSRTRRKTETWQFTNHFGCFLFKYIFLHSDPHFTTTWCWNKSSNPKILLRLFSHGRNMTNCGCPSENSKIHSGLPRLWFFLLIFGVPIFWTAPKNLYEMNKITSNHSRKITSNRRFIRQNPPFPHSDLPPESTSTNWPNRVFRTLLISSDMSSNKRNPPMSLRALSTTNVFEMCDGPSRLALRSQTTKTGMGEL